MGKYLKENPHNYSEEYANDSDQRKYFANMALRYLSLIKLHRENKHLPSLKNLSPEQIAENVESSGQKDWSGVVRHCLAEAGAADALGQLLQMSATDRETLMEAAILHDCDKKVEIETLRTSSGGKTKTVAEIKKMSNSVLLQKGVPQEIVDIINMVGDVEIVNKERITLLQKALFYIDNITEGTNLVTIRTKYEGLTKRYPKLTSEGYYDKWVASTEEVQEELAKKIGLDNPAQLPNIILQKVKQLATDASTKYE